MHLKCLTKNVGHFVQALMRYKHSYQASNKETIKILHHWPLSWESTSNWWIPYTKGQ